MDIADLLKLQRALQTHGVVQIPADEKDGAVVEETGGEVLRVLIVLQIAAHFIRQGLELRQDRLIGLLFHRSQQVCKVETHQIQRRQLGGVPLAGGHGNLGTGPGVKHIIGLAGNGGTKHVHNRQHVRATLPALSHCRNGVGRFTGLGNHNHQRIRANDRAAITKLRGNVNLHRNPRGLLQNILAHRRHVI